jgi:hypothetical protein
MVVCGKVSNLAFISKELFEAKIQNLSLHLLKVLESVEESVNFAVRIK